MDIRVGCTVIYTCGRRAGSFGLIHEDMNPKMGVLLRLMPLGNNMDMGKGYDDMIGCATCSLSQYLMQQVWLPCFILVVSLCLTPHVCLMVVQWTCINSVDTFLYPYALPLLIHPLYFLKSLPKCNLSSSLRSLQVSQTITVCCSKLNK